MKRLQFSLIVSLLLNSTTVFAEDLLQVYQLAVKSDPQLLAEAASLRAVGELDAQSLALFLPQINLGADTSKVQQDTSSSVIFDGDRDFNRHGYNLSITQPLYRKQNFVQRDQAGIAINIATANYQLVEQALIVRVAERYFDLLARQDDLGFANAERDADARQLEQTKNRFEVGVATITDVAESQAGYDLSNARVIEAENELRNSRERLRETTGVILESVASLQSDAKPLRPDPEDIDEWASAALVQNPAMVAAQLAVKNAEQEIELQSSGHYPSLDLVGGKNYASTSDGQFGGAKTHDTNIGLQFNVPIYEGGAVVSRTREASYRLDQSMQNEEQQRRLVYRQSREAYNDVISGISRVQALKQAVISGESALESTEAGYEVGTRTTVDVLNVRRNLFSARRDHASARYLYILSTLRLKQAAGTVSVADLEKMNQWFKD